MTLCLSYNNIRKFSPELARCEALERIVLAARPDVHVVNAKEAI